MTGDLHQRELDRIHDAYTRREGDAAASLYSFSNPTYLLHVQELEWRLRRVLGKLGLGLEGSSLLDVGCGTGRTLQRLVELGAREGTGIDLMEDRVRAGQRLYPTLDLRAGDASELPFADGSFDLVLQLTCLSSVLDETLRRRIAAEMWRVTRPGGAVVSYDMRPMPALGRAALALLGFAGRRRGSAAGGSSGTPTRALAPRELRLLFPGAATVAERPVSLEFGLGGLCARSRALHAVLSSAPGLRSHLLFAATKPATR